MEKVKKLCNRIFIEGLSGMAQGLFATLLVGTILEQIGTLIGGAVGGYLIVIAAVAKKLTGAGIGVGVAARFRQSALVSVSAAAAGMIGAYAKEITAGTLLSDGVFTLAGVGEPLGAFVAAYLAVELGGLVSGKTRVDILVTPITTICTGAIAGLSVVGVPPTSGFSSKWIIYNALMKADQPCEVWTSPTATPSTEPSTVVAVPLASSYAATRSSVTTGVSTVSY